jgi:hypothetical protein
MNIPVPGTWDPTAQAISRRNISNADNTRRELFLLRKIPRDVSDAIRYVMNATVVTSTAIVTANMTSTSVKPRRFIRRKDDRMRKPDMVTSVHRFMDSLTYCRKPYSGRQSNTRPNSGPSAARLTGDGCGDVRA